MSFRLPPLNSLRFFEAAGRLQSFKLAAEELEVTPSAVSHGIQSLEDWMGAALFARSNRGLALTEAGREYLPAVQTALTLLATATDRLPGRPPRTSLAISVAQMFGARILLPRLQQFRDLHPEVALQIDSSNRQVEFPRDGFDVAIRIGTGEWPGLAATLLLTELLVPVCSPDLLERLGPKPELHGAPLIHISSASQDWAAWAEQAGHDAADRDRALVVDTYQLALDAAVQGLGIAVARLPLAAAELESGRLVRFCEPAVPSKTSYWLVGLPDTMQRPDILSFRDWLRGEIASLGQAYEQ